MTVGEKTAKRHHCPSCDNLAKRVSSVTLRTLLKDEFATAVGSIDHSCCHTTDGECPPVTEETGWRFCDSTKCDVVYFSEQGSKQFTKSQLKVPVGVKETSGERPLCYCFDHSVTSIKDELRLKGRSDALEDIRSKMKVPGCHCETSNPSGACCLGTITQGIEVARNELGMETPQRPASSKSDRGEIVAKAGTVISAAIASACCWLPLLLLAVGVSGAGIASTLETYRPLFMVVTFGFLGAAFYFTYRPQQKAAAGHNCCDPKSVEGDPSCSTAGKQSLHLMALNKVMLWGVTLLAVAFLFLPSYIGAFFVTETPSDVPADTNHATFRIEGMSCEGCATALSESIKSLPGISQVQVNFKQKEAIVHSPACCSFPKEAVLSAIQESGFEGQVVKPRSSTDSSLRPDPR